MSNQEDVRDLSRDILFLVCNSILFSSAFWEKQFTLFNNGKSCYNRKQFEHLCLFMDIATEERKYSE